MSEFLSYEYEERNKNIGQVVSLILHALLLLICIVKGFTYYDPPLYDRSVIQIEFDTEEELIVQDNFTDDELSQKGETVSSQPSQAKNSTPPPPSPSSKSSNDLSTITQDESPVKTVKSPKSTEKKKTAVSQEDTEKEKADAEAKKREEEYNNSKSKFSSILKKGNESATESQETGNGNDPNASRLEGLVEGKGTVGADLGSRSIIYEPVINENSQKTGKIAVNICIDQSGKVTSAEFTQKGSTTTDSYLVGLAEKAARKYRFSEGKVEKQCGDIFIEFKLK